MWDACAGAAASDLFGNAVGEHSLKGVPERVLLYSCQLVADKHGSNILPGDAGQAGEDVSHALGPQPEGAAATATAGASLPSMRMPADVGAVFPQGAERGSGQVEIEIGQ